MDSTIHVDGTQHWAGKARSPSNGKWLKRALGAAQLRDRSNRVKYAVPVNRVPELLACSRPIVGILLELGQLDRINDHGMVESKIGKAIDSRSVQKVVWHLKKNFKQTDKLAVGMKPLAKTAEKCRIRLKFILELLFGGHLTKVVRLAGQDGFEAIHIDPAEVRTVLESPPLGLSEDVYLLFD